MRFIWPFLLKQMQDRETRIADGLAAAEKGQQALVQAEKRHAELVDEGKHKAAEIITQAERRRDEIIDESKTSARSEGERLIQAAKADIDRERTQAKEKLKAEVAALALAGAEQVLMREVDKKAHNEILAKVSAGL
jgi:F-type H+-transporting ATPase subunit b